MRDTIPAAAAAAALFLTFGGCSGSGGGAPSVAEVTLRADRGGLADVTTAGFANLLGPLAARAGLALDPVPVTPPAHGTVHLHTDGSFVYLHDGSAGGVDSFRFRVHRIGDPGAASIGTVTITVVDPTPAPFAPLDDAFADAVGNVPFELGLPIHRRAIRSSGSLLANDGGTSPTVTAHDATSAAGGTVAVHADGTFRYVPPTGFAGRDTFRYTATDGTEVRTATVTLDVAAPVWFVVAGGAGPTVLDGDGSSEAPFQSLAAIGQAQGSEHGPGPGALIHVDSGTYVGELRLLAGQTLHGAGVELQRGALRIAAGAPPLLTNPGDGVLVAADDCTIRGVTIGDSREPGLVAVATTGVVVEATAIIGDGPALLLMDSTVDITLTSVTSTMPDVGDTPASHAIHITDCGGRVQVLGDVVLQRADGDAVRVIGWAAGAALTLHGDLDVVAPGDLGLRLENVAGGVTVGGAITIAGRTHGGVLIAGGSGTIDLGETSIPNPGLAVGTPFAVRGGSATIRVARLDVDGVSAQPVLEPYEAGVALAIRDFAGSFAITAGGPSGVGGVLDTAGGASGVVVHQGTGSVALSRLTVGPTREHGILLVDDSSTVDLDRVRVVDFGQQHGDGVHVAGTAGRTTLRLWQCTIDGDSTDAGLSSGTGLATTAEAESGRSWDIALGSENDAFGACRIEDCTAGVVLHGSASGVECRFEAHGAVIEDFATSGIEVAAVNDHSTLRTRIVGCRLTVTDPTRSAAGIRLDTPDGTHRIHLRGNTIEDALDGIRIVPAAGTTSARLELNVVERFRDDGIEIDASGATLDVEILANELRQATALVASGSCGIAITASDDARALLRTNLIAGGFAGAGSTGAIRVEQSRTGGLDATLEDNQLSAGSGPGGVSVAAQHLGAVVRLALDRQAGGTLALVHDAGALGVVDLATIPSRNSGMTVAVSGTLGTVGSLAAGAVELPTVILP